MSPSQRRLRYCSEYQGSLEMEGGRQGGKGERERKDWAQGLVLPGFIKAMEEPGDSAGLFLADRMEESVWGLPKQSHIEQASLLDVLVA